MKKLSFVLIPVDRIEGYKKNILNNKFEKIDEKERDYLKKVMGYNRHNKLDSKRDRKRVNRKDKLNKREFVKADYIQEIYDKMKKDEECFC